MGCIKTIWFFGVTLSLLACQRSASPKSPPTIKDGILDLSDWDFSQDGPLMLKGEWKFYWKHLLQPDELSNNTLDAKAQTLLLKVPGSFAQKMDESLEENRNLIGYGSYLIKVTGLKEREELAVSELLAYSSAKLMVIVGSRGRLKTVSQQKVGWVAETSQDNIPVIKPSGLKPFLLEDPNHFYILIQVANFHYHWGGIWIPPMLGKSEDLSAKRDLREKNSLISLGTILALGIFNFSLFIRRRQDLASLLLSLFCLGIFARDFLAGVADATTHIQFEIIWKIYYISMVAAIPLLGFFQAINFPAYFSKKIVWLGSIVSLLYSLFVLLTPTVIFSSTFSLAQGILFLFALYIIIETAKATKARQRGALISLIGIGFLFSGTILDILWTYGISSLNTNGLLYGISLFSLCQSQIVGIRFAEAFRRSEKVNEELKKHEQARTLFFHNTSHELRTPLNGIIGFVHLLTRGHYGELPAKAKTQIDKIGELSHSLMTQVNTILDLAKSRRGEMRLVNSLIPLNEMIDEVKLLGEGLLLKTPDSKFEVICSWDQAKSPVFTNDREKLMTIIRNLIGNAFKFKDQNRENLILFKMALDDDNSLSIEVRDNGIGIAENFHEYIFEEFKQVGEDCRRIYEGSGLGLSIVNSIVNLMAGKIFLKSQPGVGSLFRVILPNQDTIHNTHPRPKWTPMQNAATNAIPSQPAALLGQKNQEGFWDEKLKAPKNTFSRPQKILVVDDNRINCEVVVDILGADGYDVEMCFGGKEAIDLIQTRKPDLMLLDLMMPEISGEDVLRFIKQEPRLKDMPVIILTARASEEDRINGLSMGADDYLAKPFVSEEILLRVSNLLSRIDLARAAAEKAALESSLASAQAMYGFLANDTKMMQGVSYVDYYQAAEITGGDWFGLSHDPKTNRLYIMMGDVTGHGMLSALVTVATAGAAKGATTFMKNLPFSLGLHESLEIVAKSINAAVVGSGDRVNRAMTMVFVCLDLANGEASYINAGHNGIFLLHEDEAKIVLAPGSPLGMSQNSEDFGYRSFRLHEGDSIFLYTDGLTENRDPKGKALSLKKLKKILCHPGSIENLKQEILRSTQTNWQDYPAEDDCTFLLVRWERSTKTQKEVG